MRGFLDDSQRPPHRKRYPSMEAAAARLRENNSTLTEAASLHLARHGTESSEGGYPSGLIPDTAAASARAGTRPSGSPSPRPSRVRCR